MKADLRPPQLNELDVEKLKQIAKRHNSRRTKRKYIKKGYINQVSYYGVLHDTKKDTYTYCRIEILSDVPIDKIVISRLYNYFLMLKPINAYTIWIYNDDKKSVKCVGRFN